MQVFRFLHYRRHQMHMFRLKQALGKALGGLWRSLGSKLQHNEPTEPRKA